MYLIDLTFTADADTLAALRHGHIAYLKPYYERQELCFGGRKVDGTGGLIVSRQTIETDVYSLMEHDPFVINGAATYRVTAFTPVMASDDFNSLLSVT